AAVAALIGRNGGTFGAKVPAGTETATFEYTLGQDGGGWHAHVPMAEAATTSHRHGRADGLESLSLIARRSPTSERAPSRRPTDQRAPTGARTQVRATRSPHPHRPRS